MLEQAQMVWFPRRLSQVAAWLALGVAAACAPLEGPPPAQLPSPPVTAPEPPSAPRPSAESELIRAYFASQEAQLLARGLMRTDGGGTDTPYTSTMLARNFIRIGLYDEYVESRGRLISQATPATLRRWEVPVRMRVEFSDTVPEEIRQKDITDIRSLAARLSRATGHPISLVQGPAARSANFRVLVLDETARRDHAAALRALVPGIDAVSVRTVTDMPRTTSCMVLAFARAGSSSYTQAVAVVRSELPDLSRLSCYHEELAQGLGLPNDSNSARPTIFNDTEEFAHLTRHDEDLLRVLYDPRLSPGMTEAEATPIVRQIAAELIGAGS